jgi:asparagine synthase (glutamine-hydrolysing)
MCGIVGIVNIAENPPVSGQTIKKMLGQIRHRGPDEFGVYLFGDGLHSVGLGSARLRIIDLGGGQQPIGNEDGTLWIVFNGEIFNYIELRALLEDRGHQFATASDTEVIVHLWEAFGPAGLSHLNGQFAFALWDERARELILARDRVGIRPLFISEQNGRLLFASEMKALLTTGLLPAAIDPLTMQQIFTTWSPAAPRTPLQGVQTLPPGHFLRLSADGTQEIKPYWQLSYPTEQPPPAELTPQKRQDLVAQCRELLLDATRLRLRADVPVGAYLSGGLDSSIITALIHRYTENKLRTFSIAFTDAQFDETPFQETVAEHLGTDHALISCSHADIGAAFPDVIRHTEMPLLRTAPVPLFLLSKLVHDSDFRVVLTGEGADEMFGGYTIFREMMIRRFWARDPESALRPLLLQKLYGYVENLNPRTLQQFFQPQAHRHRRRRLLARDPLAQYRAHTAPLCAGIFGRAAPPGPRRSCRCRRITAGGAPSPAPNTWRSPSS